jgi:L-lactate dehydrogenase (cytochrome)
MKLADCHNVAHLREAARRRLPAPMFHYIDGGADDEWSLARNTAAFDDYELLPAVMRDVSNIDLSTQILGTTLQLPFFLGPTGMSRLFHADKEIGVAQAAGAAGTLYSVSTMSTTSLEDIAALGAAPLMFQVYLFKDRGLTKEFVERCRAAKCQALCLTVDTPVAGNRERDRVHGMTMPPRFGLHSLLSFLAHPSWTLDLLLRPGFELANVAHRVDAIGAGTVSVIGYVNSQFDRTVTWDDAAWLAREWSGPFVIKGVLTPEDARRAREIGASAVMISNHGGRQLDGAAAPISCLAGIRDAVGDALELIVDGGIRRGTHILKALALGADACSLGRAYVYGLAAAGRRGVERALQLLRDELLRDMALLGCTRISELTPERIRAVSASSLGRQDR